MSDRVAKKLEEVLGDVSHDPYGNPIPARPEGPGEYSAASSGLLAISELDLSEPITATLRRVAEPLQVDIDLLADFRRAGVLPGVEITVEKTADGLILTGGEGSIDAVPEWMGKHLFIDA